MSSMIRRMQIRFWKKQGKKPFTHNGIHGGKKNGTPVLAWPLRSTDFIKEEENA